MSKDLLEIARRNAERAQEVLSNRQKREERRTQMAAEHDHGRGLNVSQLAEKYGVGLETVRNDLKAAGVYTPQRRTTLTPELRAAIIADIRQSPADLLAIGERHAVSYATVRKLGMEEGLLERGAPRKRRTAEDFEELERLDGDLKAVHGAGLQALGASLYAWRRRQAANGKPTAPASAPSDGHTEPVAVGAPSDEAPWE